MAESLKSLGIDRLGIEERLALVEELWDSAAVPVTAAQATELDRRLTDYLANPKDGVPWEEVRSSLSKRLGK